MVVLLEKSLYDTMNGVVSFAEVSEKSKVKCDPKPMVPLCVRWQRTTKRHTARSGEVHVEETTQDETQALVIMPAKELIKTIEERTLLDYMEEVEGKWRTP